MEQYMRQAIENAKVAFNQGEVPVGCVIVMNDVVIASTYNMKHQKQTALAHAEIEAITIASKKLGTWILDECTMYVTLEPCPMCSGAIVQSRMKKLVFGAHEPKSGYVESLHHTLSDEKLNHQVEVVSGLLAEECSSLLKKFFADLRKKKKKNNN